MTSFKSWKISTKSLYIGCGACWDVYRTFLEEGQSIDDYRFSQFVYKICKNINVSEYEIKKNIGIYEQIKITGLPTLKFYFPEIYNGINVIIAEDLNANELLFVSPNNARNYTVSNQLLQEIQNIETVEFDENAEKYLMNNKIIEIENFDKFLDIISLDMEKISQFNIGTFEDAFFFGTYKNINKSKLFYRIADFENIIYGWDLNKNVDKLALKNTKIMLNSLWEYVDIFIAETNKKKYQKKLINKIKKIQKELGEI